MIKHIKRNILIHEVRNTAGFSGTLDEIYLGSEISEPSKLYMNRNLFYKNFKENFTIRLFNENNEDIHYEILPIHDKCIDKEKEKNTSNNYFNTNKINYFD